MNKVILRAPVLSQSGYGEHARFVLRSLRSQPGKFDIYILNINWGQTSWLWEDNEERRWIDDILKKTMQYMNAPSPQFDLSIQVTIPNEWEKLAPINIGVTAGIEVDRISPVWIEKSQLMDKIIVPSTFSKAGFDNTSYQVQNNDSGQVVDDWKNQTPVEVVPYPVKDIISDENFKLDLKTDFNFLAMAQWGPRKNVDAMVKWFVDEFHDNEDVGLILKTSEKNNSIMDRSAVQDKITNFVTNAYPDKKCKIYLVHGYLTEEEMAALFNDKQIKAFCTTTHGEGWCLPMFDAAIAGIPVVAPEWSAYTDFMTMPVTNNNKTKNKFMGLKVEYDLAPVQGESIWKGVIEEGSIWCYPKEFSFKHAIRKMYNNHGTYKKRAVELQRHVKEKYEQQKVYDQMIGVFMEYTSNVDTSDIDQWLEEMENIVQEHE
jgi:glycosyltransferase involved in cell wall biosynthesis